MVENCRHCGKETGKGELYCLECQAIYGARKRKGLWVFSVAFSTLLLSLTGLLLWHGGLDVRDISLDSIFGRPVALINGEPVTRSELKSRLKPIRSIVERQYGKGVFSGDRGRALLKNLEQETLREILKERLVAQEAQKLKIHVSEQRIQQQMGRIIQEVYGTPDNFQDRLREEGLTVEEFRDHIYHLILIEEVKSAKAPPGADPEKYFNSWLALAQQKAKVVIYESEEGGGRELSGECGCCRARGSPERPEGQIQRGRQIDPKVEEEAQRVALEAYQKTNPGEQGVTARVTDYGCHLQVDIQKNGRVVKSYIYQGGRVFENS